MTAPLRFFLIAGEPSGDRLDAALMAGLKALHPGVAFSGIGGPAMQAEGMESLFPMEELSVMGLVKSCQIFPPEAPHPAGGEAALPPIPPR